MSSQRRPREELQKLWCSLSRKDRAATKSQFIEALAVAGELSPTARLIGILLASRHLNQQSHHRWYGCAWPSQPTLRDELECSLRTVQYGLDALVETGWFDRVRTSHYVYQPNWPRRKKVQNTAPSEDEAKVQKTARSNGQDMQETAPEGAKNCASDMQPVAPKPSYYPSKDPSKHGNGTSAPLASPLEGGSRGAAPVLTKKLRSIEHRLKNGDIGPLTAARYAQRLVDEVYIEQDRERIAQVINTALNAALAQPRSPAGKWLSKQAEAGMNIENVWRELVCMPEGDAKRVLEGVQSEVAA